ncbi:MAG: hypothetical protein WC412_02195 [Candidatus Omnitrophota bacterium]
MRKAQAALESALAYMAAIALLAAALGIWAWGNGHVPIRQVTYEVSRVVAGSSARSVSQSGASGGSKGAVWPTYMAPPAP